MRTDKKTIDGTRLYALRMQMGISLAQAAALLGISKSTLCRYESRKNLQLNRDRIDAFCRIYRVGEEELIRTNGEEEGRETLDPEELAAYYRRLDERTQTRISRILRRALD